MDITKMKFKTINKDKNSDRTSHRPFITLNHNSIYLPKVISLMIKQNEWKFVMVRVSDCVVSLEFLKKEINGSFNIYVNDEKKSGIIYSIIGSSALSNQIAKEFNIVIDKNRYYKSIDSEINNNIMYFQFDRNQCIFRKTSK